MGQVAHPLGGDSNLVARASSSLPERRCLRIHEKDAGIFPHAQKYYHATKGCSDYMALPIPHCLKCNHHLPPSDTRSSAQDYHLKQPEMTLAYAKALQHWAKVAKPPPSGESCQLEECIKELRRCVELLTTFTDGEVLAKDPPSPWVMVTPSWCSEVVDEEAQEALRDWSHSRCWRAHSWDSFSTTPFLGCFKPLVISSTVTTSTPTISSQWTGAPNIFTQWVKTPPDSPAAQKWTPPPRFVEIARSLWGMIHPTYLVTSHQSWQLHRAFWWRLPWPPWCPHSCNKMPWQASPT